MRTMRLLSVILWTLGCAGANPSWDHGGDDPGGGGDDEDVGGDDPGDDGDDPGPVDTTPTAFRIRTLALRDPHISVDIFGTCADITDTEVAGMSVNGTFRQGIEGDTMDKSGQQQPDGLLDLSFLVIFRPLAPQAASSEIELAPADCSAPLSGTRCTPGGLGSAVSATAANQPSGACMDLLPGTTSGYSPSVTLPSAPCFHGGPLNFQLAVAGLTMNLSDAMGAASYQGDPATGLVNGAIRGFVRESDANVASVQTPIGTKYLSEFLPGGARSCASRDDRDTGPDGTRGWYFYLNFTAEPVSYSE